MQSKSCMPEVEDRTIIVTLEQDLKTALTKKVPGTFEFIFCSLGEGELRIGDSWQVFRQGDVVITGPEFQSAINFNRKKKSTGPKLILYRLSFLVSSGWKEFIALTDNIWMRYLLQQADQGLHIRGDHYNELDKLLRQLHTKGENINTSLFLRYLREIFELQNRTGMALIKAKISDNI